MQSEECRWPQVSLGLCSTSGDDLLQHSTRTKAERTDSLLDKQGKRSTAEAQSLQLKFFRKPIKRTTGQPVAHLPSQPSPYCCSPSMMGEIQKKSCNSGRIDRKSKNSKSTRTLSPDRGTTRPTNNDMWEPPYTSPRIGLHAKCAKEHNMKFSTLCSSSPGSSVSGEVSRSKSTTSQ